jgi:hypothetical protein
MSPEDIEAQAQQGLKNAKANGLEEEGFTAEAKARFGAVDDTLTEATKLTLLDLAEKIPLAKTGKGRGTVWAMSQHFSGARAEKLEDLYESEALEAIVKFKENISS